MDLDALRRKDVEEARDDLRLRRDGSDGGQRCLRFVELYPPGRLDPEGVHGVIWTRSGQAATELPADRPLVAASYEAAPEATACVEPFRVGDVVPSMPLFLAVGEYEQVPLDPAYTLAFETVPEHWRERVRG